MTGRWQYILKFLREEDLKNSFDSHIYHKLLVMVSKLLQC